MDNQKIVISKLGSLLNLPVLTVERNPVDPDWSRKVSNDDQRLVHPVYLYSIKQIIINQAKVTNNANGTKVVQFNDDPDLQMSLLNVKDIKDLIPEPTDETVKEAVLAAASGGKKKLFTDYAKLFKFVAALNVDSKAIWDRELQTMLRFSKVFTEANDIEKTACEKALKDIGIDPNGVL